MSYSSASAVCCVDAFNDLMQIVPELLPPLLNWIFDTDFDPQAKVEFGVLPAETPHLPEYRRAVDDIVIDSLIRVTDKGKSEEFLLIPQLERSDDEVVRRLHHLNVLQVHRLGHYPTCPEELPRIGLLYLGPCSEKPRDILAVYSPPDIEVPEMFRIPVCASALLSADEILEKNLVILFPFHLFHYYNGNGADLQPDSSL